MPSSVALTTLLFDLDGTLLDIDMPSFLEAYFELLAPHFGHGGDREGFRRKLYGSVRLMLHNRDGEMGLDRIFLEDFSPRVGMSEEKVCRVFDEFYRGDFESLSRLASPVPGALALLERAAAAGYTLVLATNPVFFLPAIEARVRWAGLGRVPFSFISSAENMHFSKPHPEYFLEVLSIIKREPGECVMIGNDPVKDMPAGAVGMTTYFVPSPDERRRPASADFSGTLQDFGAWLFSR